MAPSASNTMTRAGVTNAVIYPTGRINAIRPDPRWDVGSPYGRAAIRRTWVLSSWKNCITLGGHVLDRRHATCRSKASTTPVPSCTNRRGRPNPRRSAKWIYDAKNAGAAQPRVSQNGGVSKRRCLKTAVSQNGGVSKRRCLKTAVHQIGVALRTAVDREPVTGGGVESAGSRSVGGAGRGAAGRTAPWSEPVGRRRRSRAALARSAPAPRSRGSRDR